MDVSVHKKRRRVQKSAINNQTKRECVMTVDTCSTVMYSGLELRVEFRQQNLVHSLIRSGHIFSIILDIGHWTSTTLC